MTDRTRETLVSSDRYLIHVRRRLMNAARALIAGQEPAKPWHPEAYRLRSHRMEVPAGTPVTVAVKHLIKETADAKAPAPQLAAVAGVV